MRHQGNAQGESQITVKRKRFPTLRMGNITMQGVRTLIVPLWMPSKQKKINEERGHLAETDIMLPVIIARLGIHVLSLKCGLVAVPNKVI